jgi:hypothetical protein
MRQTDRDGVNAVEGIFIRELNWIFREQTISDWGIDAHVEVTNRDEPIGRLLALQIKSGKSFFRKRGDNFVFYGEGRHLRYWRNHSLPVAIILHDPETGLTLWQRVEESLVKYGKKDRWSIEIPPDHILNVEAREGLERGVSDITALRKLRLTLDLPLIREFASKPEVYFSIDEWVNKSLGMRDVSVYFNSDNIDDGEPDHVIGAWYPTHSISEYMANVWPWLSYEYIDDMPERSGYEEVEAHKINVVLNDLGKAFLTLEDYYANGADVIEPEYPEPELEYDPDAEEYYAWLEEEERKEKAGEKPPFDPKDSPF